MDEDKVGGSGAKFVLVRRRKRNNLMKSTTLPVSKIYKSEISTRAENASTQEHRVSLRTEQKLFILSRALLLILLEGSCRCCRGLSILRWGSTADSYRADELTLIH